MRPDVISKDCTNPCGHVSRTAPRAHPSPSKQVALCMGSPDQTEHVRTGGPMTTE